METVREIIRAKGLPVDDLINRAMAQETKDAYDALTQEAIDRNVFGAPTYIYNDELFWGQDRLDFLQRALSQDEAAA
jgi:2-hydroxychromene-2-carboxylate isomerase